MKKSIGLYMYTNDGGDEVIKKLVNALERSDLSVHYDFDLRNAYVVNGRVFTANGFDLSALRVIYHMNAEERDEHQESMLQALELSGVKVVNSYQSYRLAKDKFYANQILRLANVRVPDAILLPKKYDRQQLQAIFSQWNVALLKPRFGFSGKGIIKFTSFEQFDDYYYAIHPYYPDFYLEKFIPFHNHDYRIELIGDDVIGGYSRKKTHSFKSNVGAGATLISNDYDQEQVNIAKRAMNAIGLTTSIVDMIKSEQDEQFYVLEVNDSMGIFVEACLRNQHRLSADYLQPEYCYDDKKVKMLAHYLIRLTKDEKLCTQL